MLVSVVFNEYQLFIECLSNEILSEFYNGYNLQYFCNII